MCVVLWPTITGLPTCGTAHHNTSNRRAIKYHHGLLDSIVKRLTACWRYSNMNPKRLKTPDPTAVNALNAATGWMCLHVYVVVRFTDTFLSYSIYEVVLFVLFTMNVFMVSQWYRQGLHFFFIGVGLCTVTIKSFIKSLNLVLIHSLGSSEEAQALQIRESIVCWYQHPGLRNGTAHLQTLFLILTVESSANVFIDAVCCYVTIRDAQIQIPGSVVGTDTGGGVVYSYL